ncbi:hypothetical protein [Microbacterium sp. P5_E9]
MVTALGLVISLGVIALGFFLVALPIIVQAFSVDGQTAVVASTNAIYQAQVDELSKEEENLEQINASVLGLRSQIPVDGQLDDVFEVIGRAAATSGVALTSVTAGQQVAFAPRSSTEPAGTVAPTDDTGATEGSAETTAVDPGSPGRQQVDFSIQATAADMGEVTAFLDALRAGPRLLNSITVFSAEAGEGITVQISALTYVHAEG